MTKAELYEGPFDGRQLDVPGSPPFLRVPVTTVPLVPRSKNTVLVARYVRVDRAFGTKLSYRYTGQEEL